MPDFVAPIRALDSEAQRGRAFDLAEIVAPYGTLDSGVIDPAAFVALHSRLDLDLASVVEAGAVGDECESIIDRFAEEPDGRGVYAFGAVVALYYASQAARREPEAAVNCAKRFVDLLGFADDDGVSGLFDEAVSYLASRHRTHVARCWREYGRTPTPCGSARTADRAMRCSPSR